MPPFASTLRRAVTPSLALLASVAHPAPAVAEEAPAAVPVASASAAAGGATLAEVPRSGRLVRVSDRQLGLTTGRTVSIRGRSTTVPVHVELRVGAKGRVIDEANAGAGRRFKLRGRAKSGERLRLIATRTDGGSETADVAVGQVRKLRPTVASWYGPGLFGNRTACGQTLTTGLRGVAHKHLPCGTKLTVRFGGRSTRATVVDRGPFHGGREFDLTQATAKAIGFRHVGRVWVSGRS